MRMLNRSHEKIAVAVESLEKRQFFAATSFDVLSSLRNAGHAIIGPTDGSIASETAPSIREMQNTVGATPGSTATTNVDRDTTVVLSLTLPHGAVAEPSLSRSAVQIIDTVSGLAVSTDNVKTSGGGDTISIKPVSLLVANRTYRVEVNVNPSRTTTVADIEGNAFTPYSATFTTGTFAAPGDTNIMFDKSVQVTKGVGGNGSFAAVTIGPDGKLYAGTLQGYIYRYDINTASGGLSNETRLDIVRNNNGGARFITGLTFDPRSTADNPVLWVSHGQAKFGNTTSTYADNHSGKISRIYKDMTFYEDVVVNIPRSVKDHLNNQIAFDPVAKNLYFLIPSLSAMGAADSTWGNRPEELTTAALMRLQLRSKGTRVGIEEWLQSDGPINLDPSSARKYNPYKGTNPLRFFATGIRNAYDMVFHSNGHFYMPANGSSAGGNTPATPADLSTVPYQLRLDGANGPYTGPSAVGLTNVNQTIDDYLYDLDEGGYYGHPNPVRGEYILNGGDPTGTNGEWAEVRPYPDGTQPDRNFRPPAYSFGKNVSPNGVIEYRSGSFGGRLRGSLIVARYNSGSDLIAVKPNTNGTIDAEAGKTGIIGFTNLNSPLDLVEDTRNGNIYVVSLITREKGDGQITLLKPQVTAVSAPQAETNVTRLGLYVEPGGAGFTKSVTLTNFGDQPLVLDRSATKITGTNRRNFGVTNLPADDLTLAPGESYTFNVIGALAPGQTSTAYGNLALATNDPDGTYAAVVQLRAFNITASRVASETSETRPLSVSLDGAGMRFSATRIGDDVFGDEADESGQHGGPLV